MNDPELEGERRADKLRGTCGMSPVGWKALGQWGEEQLASNRSLAALPTTCGACVSMGA